uniref:Rif1_N domain-containing protein n=1 Tax=Strongyloides venezuelensis TaxID=75913 RepID=A0A0K0EYC3_STRVS
MPPKRDSSSWAPYGLAGLKPSLPDNEIIEKFRRSSKYFSRIIESKEKNLSRIDDSAETAITSKSHRKEQAGLKAIKEIEELRKDKSKYASWMETLISDGYIKKENDEISALIVSNVIKISAIACPDIPFRSKETAAEIFEVVLEIFPKIVNVEDRLFDDYCEILNIFYLYDIESIITDWIGTNCLDLTEKLLTSIIKCAEMTIPSSPSGVLIKKIGELGSLLVKILVQILSNMYISVQTLDVVFYYLVQPQKTNFKKSFELCSKALSKADAYPAVVGASRIIRESLVNNSLLSGKRSGDKLFSIIHSLEVIVPGFINDLVGDVQKLATTGGNDKARHCLWICALEPSSKVLSKISNPEQVFKYRPEWTDSQKVQNIAIITKIIENSNERLPYIDSYVSNLFKDTHINSKLQMLNSIYGISTKNFSKISEKVLKSIGSLVLDPEETVRHKAMTLLGSIHLKLYTDNAKDAYKERVIYAMSYFFNFIKHSNSSDIQKLERILVSSILSSKIDEEQKLDIMEKLFICFNSIGIFTFCILLQNRSTLFGIVRDILFVYDDVKALKDEHIMNEFLNVYSSPNALSLYKDLPKIFNSLKDHEKFKDLYDIYTSGELSIKTTEGNLTGLLEKLLHSSVDKKSFDEFRKLVERSAPLFMDKSFARHILSTLSKLSKEGKKANILRVYYLTTIVRRFLNGFEFNFLSSIRLMVDVVSNFDIEPISDCVMYILRNIFASNIRFDLSSEEREMLTDMIMKSFEKGTPKVVKYGVSILFHMTPPHKLQQVVDDLINKYSNNLETKSSQCSRSLTILSEILRCKETVKTGKSVELNFPEGFWEGLVEKAINIVENSPRNLTDDYKVISNADLREVMIDPNSKILSDFEKRYSFAASHDGVRLPLTRIQFSAFPLYFDKSTYNIISAINLVYNALTYHLQKETNLIEKVATLFRDILLEKVNYWFDFSQDQESTVKYYITKKLLSLKLNSNLDVFLNFTNLVAVSKCLHDTDYDVRSKIVNKIVGNVKHGGVPLLSLLPLVLYSSKHKVGANIEERFRKYTMAAFCSLIQSQQELSHKYKSMTDYHCFFLSEYSIVYTIICIALTPGYDNFRDMDIIKRSIPVFEAILMSYNNLSKVINISLVKNILSTMKECKLSLISEGRSSESPLIDVDYRIWVLAELCLSLGELVFGIFGTTTQTAPDVVFPNTVLVKTRRSNNQILSMNAVINELCQGTKKPKSMADIVSKSLIKLKKNNVTKKEKTKSHAPSFSVNENNASKDVPQIVIARNDDVVSSTSAAKPKSKATRSKKNAPVVVVSDTDESTTNTDASKVKTTNKRGSRKKAEAEKVQTIVENDNRSNETERTVNNQKISNDNVAPTRVTRSRTKRSSIATVVDEVPASKTTDKEQKSSNDLSSGATPRITRSAANRRAPKGRQNKKGTTIEKAVEDESFSIENVSAIHLEDGERDPNASLFDMAEREDKKTETRKRRALSRNHHNVGSAKRAKDGTKNPLASSTPYHPNSNILNN